MMHFRENALSLFNLCTWHLEQHPGRNAFITHFLHSHLFFAVQDARDEVIWIIPMCQPRAHTPQAWYETFFRVIFSWCIQRRGGRWWKIDKKRNQTKPLKKKIQNINQRSSKACYFEIFVSGSCFLSLGSPLHFPLIHYQDRHGAILLPN